MKKIFLIGLLGLFLSGCITTLVSKRQTPGGNIEVEATIIGTQAATLSIDPQGFILLTIAEDKVVADMAEIAAKEWGLR